MPSQTGSIDLTSQNSASKTATNYITADADGIKIHMTGESGTYQHQTATDTTFYVSGKKRTKVGSDGLHIYVDTNESQIASFTSSGAIVGKTAGSHFAQDATTATFYGTNGTDKNLSIETDNGVGIIKFNGDRSSVRGFTNMLGLRSYGSSNSSDNGMVTITAESEDINTASGTIGQTYLWMYSAQSNAHAELESVDGNGGTASVYVDGKNSEVDITGSLKLVNSVLAKAYGGTGCDDFGTVKTNDVSTAVNIANGGWHEIGHLELGGGLWLIIYGAQFASNATGRRLASLNASSATPSATYLKATCTSAQAVNGSGTYLHGSFVTTADTIYLMGYQTSGAALSTYGYIRGVKLRN